MFQKQPISICHGHIRKKSNQAEIRPTIIGVLAVLPRVGASASAHAELRITDETGPFGILMVGSESVAEDFKTATSARHRGTEYEGDLPRPPMGLPLLSARAHIVRILLHYGEKNSGIPEPWGPSSNGIFRFV